MQIFSQKVLCCRELPDSVLFFLIEKGQHLYHLAFFSMKYFRITKRHKGIMSLRN